MKRIIFLVSFMFIILPINALATSGSLKKDSIKECEGTLYGTHGSDNHYHIAIKSENGSYVASGEAIYTDPCPIKQDDNTDNKDDDLISDSSLKEIKINGDSINISDTMEYTTTSDVAKINNWKADYYPFDTLNVSNEYQEGNNIASGTTIKKKFRTWRWQIPRNNKKNEDGIITNRDRIRNMWAKIRLSKNYNSPLSIYDINVAYYS